MAERSITVKFKLDISDVTSGSTKMATGFELVQQRAKQAGDELDNLSRKMGKTGESATGLTARITALDVALKETETRMGAMNSQFTNSSIDKFGDKAKKAQTGLEDLKKTVQDSTNEQDKLGKKTEETGRQFEKLKGEGTFLQAALRDARDRAHDFFLEFERTGSEDSLKKWRAARTEVGNLERDLKRAAGEAGVLEQGATSWLSSLTSASGAFARGFASLINVSPEVALAIAAAITFGAPFIGGALDAALVTGVGLGGIAAGVVGQLKSPMVHDAGQQMADGIMGDLTDATKGFERPLVDALGTIGDSVRHAIAGTDFNALAAEVGPLARGVAGLIDNLGPGFTESLKESIPLLQEFAAYLPEIGRALSVMMEQIAEGKGNLSAFRMLLGILIGTIESLGFILGALSDTFQALAISAKNMSGWLSTGVQDIGRFIDMLADLLHKNPELHLLAVGFKAVGDALHWLNTQGKEWLDTHPPIEQLGRSLDGVSTSADRASAAVKNTVNYIQSLASVSEVSLDAQAKLDTAIQGISDSALPANVALAAYAALAFDSANGAESAAQKTSTLGNILTDIDHTAGSTADRMSTLAGVFRDIAESELSATDKANLLSQTWDKMYGPAIKLTDATETYNKDLLELAGTYTKDSKGVVTYSGSLDAHSRSLDMNTLAGLKNRDAIENAATSLHQLYLADIASGTSADSAAAHDAKRRDELLRTATQTGLNKDKTAALIKEYDAIPPSKNTDITERGFTAIFNDLLRTLIAQKMLMNPGMTQNEAARDINAHGGSFATGGPIVGVGGKKQDSVAIWASPGEFMQQADAVDYYGVDLMHAINTKKVPKEVFLRAGDFPMPGFADGGIVWPAAANWQPSWKFPVDLSRSKVPPADPFAGGGIPFTGANAGFILGWLHAQAGKPYVWASAGPGGYDCSGLVSAVWNILHGRNPYNHTFSTMDESNYFPLPGIGAFTAAWSNAGERGGGSVGHTAARLGNLMFESRGGAGVVVGNGVTPLSSFSHIGHYDQGGVLERGWNAMYNGTGSREVLVRPQFVDNHRGGTVVHLHRIIVDGTGLLANLRTIIRNEGGDVQQVLGPP